MARMPTPAEDDTGPDVMGAPDDAGMAADTGATDEAEETVLCTVTKKADGTYVVYKGDEPEEGEGDGVTGEQTTGDDQGAASGASIGDAQSAGGGADAAGMGATEASPQGEAYGTVSAALHAVMTILHDDENGGAGGAEGAFQAGFGATDTGGATSPPPLAQKY